MTPHPSAIDPAVLGRYLDGTAAPADLGAIEVWVAADLERRAALAALREAWAADARRLAAPYAVDAAWARFAARVGLGPGASPGASARRWGGAGAGTTRPARSSSTPPAAPFETSGPGSAFTRTVTRHASASR